MQCICRLYKAMHCACSFCNAMQCARRFCSAMPLQDFETLQSIFANPLCMHIWAFATWQCKTCLLFHKNYFYFATLQCNACLHFILFYFIAILPPLPQNSTWQRQRRAGCLHNCWRYLNIHTHIYFLQHGRAQKGWLFLRNSPWRKEACLHAKKTNLIK